jgi:hypothetical protein
LLLTSLSLKDAAQWRRDCLDDIFYMPDVDKEWDHNQTVFAVSHLARTDKIDRIVSLDDFDPELAASLREHLRIPGMGESTTRYFRDKLAMHMRGEEAGLLVPEFTERMPVPSMLKSRSMAGATGIRKVHSREELAAFDQELGDHRSFHLPEKYVPGDVFHVDSIVYKGEILFAVAGRYGRPPPGLGLVRGVSHIEYIRSHTGGIYFFETSARVGGAHIADLVEAATGVNLWAEWARVEVAGGKDAYRVPLVRHDYAGLLVSLTKQKIPDTTAFADPEIVWRSRKITTSD